MKGKPETIETKLISGVLTEGKKCSKCGEWKDLITSYYKHKLGLGGRKATCKECDKQYVEENKEKLRSYKKNYREVNKEKIQKYREDNKERIKETDKNYKEKNRDKIILYNKKWKMENREHTIKYSREYSVRNAEYFKNYRKINRKKIYLRDQKRRARKRYLPDTFTLEQKQDTLKFFNNSCAITGDSSDIHFDHVIPLNTGHGGTIYGNMIPLRGDLNFSKHMDNIFEWFEVNKERLQMPQENFDRMITWLAEVNSVSVKEYRDYVYWCHDNQHCLEDLAE